MVCITVSLCLPHHYLLGSDDLFLEFQRFTDGKKFYSGIDDTDSLIHIKLGDLDYKICDIRYDGDNLITFGQS